MDTQQIVLASRPIGTPTLDNFRVEDVVLPGLQEGEILLQGMYYSVDPYMRGRMNDAKSYVPAFQIDQPISGTTIGKVIMSKSTDLEIGDMVSGTLPWQVKTVAPAKVLSKIDGSIAPISYHLDVLGMTGLTAYFGLMAKANQKLVKLSSFQAPPGQWGL